MSHQINVLIGIQARSGSTRLPRKAFEDIGGKPMLDRVIEQCKRAALYVNTRPRNGFHMKCRVAVVTPYGDPIVSAFQSRCEVLEGPEHDVLSRYAMAVERFSADYLVRVTGDCPLIPPAIISKSIFVAKNNDYDYLSNVDERFRTSIDGTDCEIISRRLFDHIAKAAVDAKDKEHVTTMIRREPPQWAKMGVIIDPFDDSTTKLSVDTAEDLERVRRAFTNAHDKYLSAAEMFGQRAVHRL